jgi:hypothetical protein
MIPGEVLYLLYAFVQGAIMVRCTNSREAIMKHGAGGELVLYMLLAPLFTVLILATCFAYFVRWLLVVGKKP